MESVLSESKYKMESSLENMKKRFSNVRAGRANVSVLDPVMVNYYGSPTPIIQLATVSIPEARQLMIKPFDKSSLSNIEKAIYEANIGLTPNNNGDVIILVFPPLTEERRKEFVKQVKEINEETKIAFRNIRQESIDSIKKLELPEDMEKRGIERVQDLINEYNKKADEQLKIKENELMTI